MSGRIIAFGILGALIVGGLIVGQRPAEPEDTYRLVYAVGNNETILGDQLEESECRRRKTEAIEKIERTAGFPIITRDGNGSVSCIPLEFLQ